MLLLIAFFIVYFSDNCAFIYHDNSTAYFTIRAETIILFIWLAMAVIDVLFGDD